MLLALRFKLFLFLNSRFKSIVFISIFQMTYCSFLDFVSETVAKGAF